MKKIFLFFLISSLSHSALAIPCNNEKLFQAAKDGKIKLIEDFKKAKCSFHIKDTKGFSPFDLAYIYGNASLAERLMSLKEFKRGEFSPALIRYIQVGLRYLNFDAGPVNGKLNSSTTTAIKRYQKSIKHEATGQVKPQWLVVFRKELIKKAQADLKRMGYKVSSADGMWGSETRGAMTEFAKKQKIASPSYDGLYENLIYKLMIADNERNKKVIEKRDKDLAKKAKDKKEVAKKEDKKRREKEAQEKKLNAQRQNQQMLEEARKRKIAEDRRKAEIAQRKKAEEAKIEAQRREIEEQKLERQRAIEAQRRKEALAREQENRMRELEEERQNLEAQRRVEERLAIIRRENAEKERIASEARARAEAEQRAKAEEQRKALEAQRKAQEDKFKAEQEKLRQQQQEKQRKAEAIASQLNNPATTGTRERKKNKFQTISGILLFNGENNCSINGQKLQSGWCRSYYTTGNGKRCDAVISRSGTVVSLRCK